MKIVEPITLEQSQEFNEWLSAHNLCKKTSRKRMRIYRKIGGQSKVASKDFIYVVSADDYRENLEKIHNELIEKSMKVMDETEKVKNLEYIQKMTQVEEDLMMHHNIEMNWTNAKSVNFKKIEHVIKNPVILKELEEAIKNHKNYDVHNIYVERFRAGALIEEFGVAPEYDWKQFNIIVKNGHVICAYSHKDLKKISEKKFKIGIFDKFGYNLDICKKENISEIIKMSESV